LPLYEYKCEGCGETFEVIQKFADEPVTVHEKCGGHVYRLMSAPALQFKGTGWYVTDYAKGSGSVPNKGESSKNESDNKSDSGKSDSSGKSESSSKDSSSGKTSSDTATKTESKPASSGSNSSKND
jgi:putative FmdB family regulatory protein